MTDESIGPTVEDIEAYLRSTLEEAKVGPGDCRHLHVVLDTQAHTVQCRSCGKLLDAFWYLCLLSREWKQRAYRDEAAKAAYEKIREREKQDRAKGHIFQRPAKSGPAQEVWDDFVSYYGVQPQSVYYSCREWWVADGHYGAESASFLRKLIADRTRKNPR